MKFSLNWLKNFLEVDCADATLLNDVVIGLTSIGLEVESVRDYGSKYNPFKIAHIIDTVPHPNASRLQVCRVNDGEKELQIVCGAPNARAGLYVVLAPIGTIMPNGLEIKAAKIREVESFGMLCSSEELEIDEQGEKGGIMELQNVTSDMIGKSFSEYYGLNDPVIEISITPNRSDCFGVYGIARDLGAYAAMHNKQWRFKNYSVNSVEEKVQCKKNVTIDDNSVAVCSYIGLREVCGINNAQSPQWLQNYLRNVDMVPISAIVDISNYICLTFGQPIHMYDSDKLSGDMHVSKGITEEFEALNGEKYNIHADDIVIRDEKHVCALAGIMGGERSKFQFDIANIDSNTKNIFIESAVFDAIEVTKTGRRHNIISDARHRFERGVDHNFSSIALNIATSLVQQYCGGIASNIISAGNSVVQLKSVKVDLEYIFKRTAIAVDANMFEKIIASLGFVIANKAHNEYELNIPSWRHDIAIPDDVAEEVARIFGFDNIKVQPIEVSILPLSKNFINVATNTLIALGGVELVTYSFIPQDKALLFKHTNQEVVEVGNPISAEMSTMRPSIVPSLLGAIAANVRRGYKSMHFFEYGPVFYANQFNQSKNYHENLMISSVRCGYANVSHNDSVHPLEKPRSVDVYDAKADLLSILKEYTSADVDSINAKIILKYDNLPAYYHPSRSAAMYLEDILIGYFGEIHPNILSAYDLISSQGDAASLVGTVVVSEVYADPLTTEKIHEVLARHKTEYNPSQYQASRRDFAFVVNNRLHVKTLIDIVMSSDPLIQEVEVFDVYENISLGENKKSIAVSVMIQSHTQNLTNDMLQEICNNIIVNVEKMCGGTIR